MLIVQMTKEAAAASTTATPSEEETERLSRSLSRMREDLRRKEGLLRAAQAQLEEVRTSDQ